MRAIQLSIGSCGQTKLNGSFDIRLRSLMDFHSTELGTRHFSASLETVVSWINYQQSCHPITPPPHAPFNPSTGPGGSRDGIYCLGERALKIV